MTSTADGPVVAVTGATGLVGERLVNALGRRARVLARPQVDLREDLPADVLDGADAVVHLAQSRRFRDGAAGAADVVAVNLTATARLLDLAISSRVRRFVLASTGGVYAPSQAPVVEDALLGRPGDLALYPASKLGAELVVAARAAEIEVVVLRFFFVYGANQQRDMLVPRLVDAVRSGRPVDVAGGTGPLLNPIHVGDAVGAVERSLVTDVLGTFNVAGPDSINIAGMAAAIGAVVGRDPVLRATGGAPPLLVADTTRMRSVLHVPTVRFADGCADVVRSMTG